MKSISRRAVWIGLLGAAAISGLAWVVATQGPLAPIKVTVTQARETSLPLSLFGIGTIEARRSYAIGPTAAGRVSRVLVDQGDVVSAGQALAEMDPVDMEDRVTASRASAQRARELAHSAEAAVAEARSRAKIARASAARYAELRQKNFISQEGADTKYHEAKAAEAALAGATATLAAARDEARRADADQAGANKARANLQMLSPVAGVIAVRLAEPGSTLVAGQSVLLLVDPTSLWVKARVDQGRSAGLAPGLPVDIVLRSRPNQILPGKVERVDLIADAVAEERIANVSFLNAPQHLTIGELAEVTINLPAVAHALVIPAASLKRIGKQEGVWQLRNRHTVFRPLTIGARSLDGRSQVISGLSAGDSVVVHSSRPLAPDLRVKIVDSLLPVAP